MKYVQCTDTEPGAWDRVVTKTNIDTALQEAANLISGTERAAHGNRHNTRSDTGKEVAENMRGRLTSERMLHQESPREETRFKGRTKR